MSSKVATRLLQLKKVFTNLIVVGKQTERAPIQRLSTELFQHLTKYLKPHDIVRLNAALFGQIETIAKNFATFQSNSDRPTSILASCKWCPRDQSGCREFCKHCFRHKTPSHKCGEVGYAFCISCDVCINLYEMENRYLLGEENFSCEACISKRLVHYTRLEDDYELALDGSKGIYLDCMTEFSLPTMIGKKPMEYKERCPKTDGFYRVADIKLFYPGLKFLPGITPMGQCFKCFGRFDIEPHHHIIRNTFNAWYCIVCQPKCLVEKTPETIQRLNIHEHGQDAFYGLDSYKTPDKHQLYNVEDLQRASKTKSLYIKTNLINDEGQRIINKFKHHQPQPKLEHMPFEIFELLMQYLTTTEVTYLNEALDGQLDHVVLKWYDQTCHVFKRPWCSYCQKTQTPIAFCENFCNVCFEHNQHPKGVCPEYLVKNCSKCKDFIIHRLKNRKWGGSCRDCLYCRDYKLNHTKEECLDKTISKCVNCKTPIDDTLLEFIDQPLCGECVFKTYIHKSWITRPNIHKCKTSFYEAKEAFKQMENGLKLKVPCRNGMVYINDLKSSGFISTHLLSWHELKPPVYKAKFHLRPALDCFHCLKKFPIQQYNLDFFDTFHCRYCPDCFRFHLRTKNQWMAELGNLTEDYFFGKSSHNGFYHIEDFLNRPLKRKC